LMASVSKEKASPNIEELLRGGMELIEDHLLGDWYELNYKKISAEEYKELRNKLFTYLNKECEVENKYKYTIGAALDEIVLYKCPIGKVGVRKTRRRDGMHETIYAEAGETAWADIKDVVIADLLDSLEEIAPPYEEYGDEYDQIIKDMRNITELPN